MPHEVGHAANLPEGWEDVFGTGPVTVITGEDRQSSWSSADPGYFYSLRDVIREQAGLDISAEAAGRILNAWGSDFFASNDRFPRYEEITRNQKFWTDYARAAVRTDLLPQFFYVEGPEGKQLYENSANGVMPQKSDVPDYAMRIRGKTTFQTGPLGEPTKLPLPTFSQEEVNQIINFDAMGGSRGGGGGGRADRVFDRAQIEEAVTQLWRRRMLEPPPGGLPDRFIEQAQAFWRQGGTLDLEAFVAGEMRKTAKYQTLYGKKDPSMSEDEWLSQYLRPAAQTGLSAPLVARETERGASTGAAPGAFAESLVQSRDVQAMGTGNLSRRFAQTISRIPS